MISAHLLKLRQRTEISAAEEQAIRALVSETRRLPADIIAVRAGSELNFSMLLLSGWMARAKDLSSGQRQMMELHVAGDFTDLHGFTLKRLDHDVITLSECTVGIVPHEALRAMTERMPRLTRIYWFFTNLDAAIHREWTLSLGQRSAISRMAHIFCEMHVRLGIVGCTNGESYDFPLTQRELAECLGLTVVHANRTLQELRRRGLVELASRRLTIVDRDGLCGLAEFDPSYLYLEKRDF